MKKIVLVLALLVLAAAPASADIINGGFESGNLSGWTVTGQTSVVSGGTDPRTLGHLSLPGVGGFSAMVGDAVAWGFTGSQSSSISQQFTSDGTDLYFAWAAVGLVPTNSFPHDINETPWFQVRITKNGTQVAEESFFTGNIGSILPGWTAGATQPDGGTNNAGIWYYRPWETYHLSGLAADDVINVILTTRDCTPSGHSSYAYLDGFGGTPPDIVPEPTTLLLFGTGLAAVARRLRKR